MRGCMSDKDYVLIDSFNRCCFPTSVLISLINYSESLCTYTRTYSRSLHTGVSQRIMVLYYTMLTECRRTLIKLCSRIDSNQSDIVIRILIKQVLRLPFTYYKNHDLLSNIRACTTIFKHIFMCCLMALGMRALCIMRSNVYIYINSWPLRRVHANEARTRCHVNKIVAACACGFETHTFYLSQLTPSGSAV